MNSHKPTKKSKRKLKDRATYAAPIDDVVATGTARRKYVYKTRMAFNITYGV